MGRQRSNSLVLGAVLATATGVAFAGGARLRSAQTVSSAPLQPIRGGQVAFAEKGATGLGHALAPAEAGSASATQQGTETFELVYERVQKDFCDKLPGDAKLSRGIVKQMVAVLEDPNSYFLEPVQRTLLENEGKGKLAGIGAALSIVSSKKDGYTDYKIVVVDAIPGSPAEKAGLKPGDVVTHVDGKWVLGYNPLLQYSKMLERFRNRDASEDEVEKSRLATRDRITGGIMLHQAQMLLRGDKLLAKTTAAKPKYTIKVQRPGVATPITVEVTPSTTEIPGVTEKTITAKAGYLKIPFFATETPDAVTKALETLPKDGPGLVVDLRGNPGGSLDAASKVAGLLTGKGVLAVTVGAKGKKTPLATTTDAVYKGRITVLVDHGTASTAEALALCLAENGAATLAGEKTFGDGLLQALYPLEDGSGFTLSIGKLTSAKGVAWAGTGITPQVRIAAGTAEDQVLARAVATLTAPKIAQTGTTKG